jgi:uncharacterized protein (DUF983 family)
MARDLTIGDVLHPRAEPLTMLRRGLSKHCPRCGGGKLYRGWFRMLDRCPSCGYKFAREEGFFFGAYIVNLVITEAVLFGICLGYIGVHGAEGSDLRISLIAACAAALVVPVVFYPFSRTLWSAIDLIFTPLELDEIVEAADAVGEGAIDEDPAERGSEPLMSSRDALPETRAPDASDIPWRHRGRHRAHRRRGRSHPRPGGDGPGSGRV